jgi:hypothetical protein
VDTHPVEVDSADLPAELAEYTAAADAEPLPASVREVTFRMGQVARAAEKDVRRAGLAFEFLTNVDHQSGDHPAASLARLAGPWLNHPQAPGVFSEGWLSAEEMPAADAPSAAASEPGWPASDADLRPPADHEDAIQRVCEELARIAGSAPPTALDRHGAEAALIAVSDMVRGASIDPRITSSASITSAIQKLADALDARQAKGAPLRPQ